MGAGEPHDAAVVTDEEAAFVVRIANVGRLTTKQPQGFGANAALSRSDDPVVDPFVRLRGVVVVVVVVVITPFVVGRSGAHLRHIGAMRRNIGGTIADVRRASHALRIPDQTFGARLTSDSTTATDEKAGYWKRWDKTVQ